MNSIQSYTLPVSYALKKLRESDFALDTRDKLCIFDDNCTLVLFYTETPTSKQFLSTFQTVAETMAGVSYATCNVMLEKKVAEALIELYKLIDHPFSWTGSRPFPFIIVFRRGYPICFYDGPMDIQILMEFIGTYANNPQFNLYNFPLREKVREEMMSKYRDKNPIVVGAGLTSSFGTIPYVLPAVPYNRR